MSKLFSLRGIFMWLMLIAVIRAVVSLIRTHMHVTEMTARSTEAVVSPHSVMKSKVVQDAQQLVRALDE